MSEEPSSVALVGATVIDGNSGAPIPSATVLVEGGSIAAVGAKDSIEIPDGARVVDAAGKFLIPGFIDTNVHLALHAQLEEMVRYRERYVEIALETAQLNLRYGVTTVHDSYGPLKPLLAARDTIARGDAVGPRVYVAGNIVGWGGPWSLTFAAPGSFKADYELYGLAPVDLSYFMEQMQDDFTEGTGEELIVMEPEELREAMNAYLDKGIDLVKYGGTNHAPSFSMILFSPEAQKVIVDETHKRGKFVETHSTSPEGQRISLEAGIDLIQHPDITDMPMSDRLAELHASCGVTCSMHTGAYTGEEWTRYQEKLEQERTFPPPEPPRPLTGMDRRRRLMKGRIGWYRQNAHKLLQCGCTMTAASDSLSLQAPELTRNSDAMPSHLMPGTGTLEAIEGLVEIGMTPMQALVAATKNGAMAAKALDDYGTIDVGKAADLLLLDADPLADIQNIRKQSLVMVGGRVVDTATLPTAPVLYQRAPEEATQQRKLPAKS